MKLAVLRLSSRNGQPEGLATELGVECDSIWHIGDQRTPGRICDDCGIVATVSDAAFVGEMAEEIRQFVRSRQAVLSRALASGWDAELDLGITVGDAAQMTATVSLEPELLRALGDLGVRLSVSAYPVSDEDESQAV